VTVFLRFFHNFYHEFFFAWPPVPIAIFQAVSQKNIRFPRCTFFHPFFGPWESAAAVAAFGVRTIGSQNANKQIIHISSIDWRGGKAKFDIRDRLKGRRKIDESAWDGDGSIMSLGPGA